MPAVNQDLAKQDSQQLLSVRDLCVNFESAAGSTEAVRNVSFEVGPGEIVGIVGESGSGKSVTCKAILGLLPTTASISGSVCFQNQELVGMNEESLRDLRGRKISMIFQNPSSHLDPLMSIGRQVSEPLVHHEQVTAKDARQAAISSLRDVKMDRPEQRAENFPHQLSGGMKQRAMIASAMACQPQLLLADEPTTALDVTVQAHILELLKELNTSRNLSMILVSHDLAVIAQICDRIVVMRNGEVVEQGMTSDIISSPKHAYTRKLLDSQPGKLVNAQYTGALPEKPDQAKMPLLEVNQLCVNFELPRTALLQKKAVLKALSQVSIKLHRGESLGIVGESGSGKSTLARVIMGLVNPVSGEVNLNGHSILTDRSNGQEDFRRKVQMAFQNPFDSLNPRLSVFRTIAEPLQVHKLVENHKISDRVDELMDLVELDASLSNRKPGQLSGGQCQRVGIARALAMNPEILIADEITSALDVTIQAQIMDLLRQLREKAKLSVIFISHDLALVRSFCDHVAVFQSGRVVEAGSIEQVLGNPQKDYTRTLIASAPVL
ncbi:MAG: peptide/nickel transport system ATP-binding protein [Rhodothermales bacterium]|jgi:peptide/nickel transport system ATP-binding protein